FLHPHVAPSVLPSFPTRRSSDLRRRLTHAVFIALSCSCYLWKWCHVARVAIPQGENSNFAKQSQFPFLNSVSPASGSPRSGNPRSEEHTSELQSRVDLVCRLLLE